MPSFDLRRYCSIVQNHKITYSYVAPPVVLHLAKSPIVDEFDFSSLKYIVSGAAPVSRDLIHLVLKRLGVKVKQAYGLSETSPATHIQVRTKFNYRFVTFFLPLAMMMTTIFFIPWYP